MVADPHTILYITDEYVVALKKKKKRNCCSYREIECTVYSG